MEPAGTGPQGVLQKFGYALDLSLVDQSTKKSAGISNYGYCPLLREDSRKVGKKAWKFLAANGTNRLTWSPARAGRMMTAKITITPAQPYFRATADCDWRAARQQAQNAGLGQEHIDAINLAEVEAYVSCHTDDDDHDDAELVRLFRLAYGREADEDDRAEGLWSHIVASI